MPRKRKEKKEPTKKKVKNIIQQVVVNIGDKKVKRTRRRSRKQPKEAENIMDRVAPAVVYFPGPTVNLPPVPSEPKHPSQGTFSNIPIAEATVIGGIGDIPVVRPVNQSNAIKAVGNPINQNEFGPTANFISEKDKEKDFYTPDIVYTAEPESFKSPVLGNTRFGYDINEYLSPAQREKISKKETRIEGEMKDPFEGMDTVVESIKEEKKKMSAPEVRQAYERKFGKGSARDPETGKFIPVTILRKKID